LAIAISIFALVTPANAGGSCPQWETVIRKAGLPVKEFSYIAHRESGCRIKAINARYDKNGKVIWTLNKNGSIDRGLFQINSVHKQTVRTVCKGDLDELLTLGCNLKVAKYLYDRYGMTPWKGHSITPQSRTDAPAIRNVAPLDNLARNK
jgi:hypothetical protein